MGIGIPLSKRALRSGLSLFLLFLFGVALLFSRIQRHIADDLTLAHDHENGNAKTGRAGAINKDAVRRMANGYNESARPSLSRSQLSNSEQLTPGYQEQRLFRLLFSVSIVFAFPRCFTATSSERFTVERTLSFCPHVSGGASLRMTILLPYHSPSSLVLLRCFSGIPTPCTVVIFFVYQLH